jgi:hypothetical protein
MPLSLIDTLQVSTGNPATVNDKYDPTQPNNGAQAPLGAAVVLAGPNGFQKFRYVRLNATTPPASFVVGPVYWKDATQTVVTTNSAEAAGGLNAVAGVLVNPNATNGNFVLIQVAGYISNLATAAGAAGDAIVPAAGQQAVTNVASGTAPGLRPIAYLVTAAAGGAAAARIVLESVD